MCSSPKEKGAAGAAPLKNRPKGPFSEDRIAREHPVSGASRCFGSPTISRPDGGVSRPVLNGSNRVSDALQEVSDGFLIDDERGRDAQDVGTRVFGYDAALE